MSNCRLYSRSIQHETGCNETVSPPPSQVTAGSHCLLFTVNRLVFKCGGFNLQTVATSTGKRMLPIIKAKLLTPLVPLPWKVTSIAGF